MCIANTLRDIAEESSLNKAEKVVLRKIAREYEKLQTKNKRLRKLLREIKKGGAFGRNEN